MELHALTTTLGRIIPIFYPGVTFGEYGYSALQIESENCMEVSEDGNWVTEYDTYEIYLEFKGPIQDKKHTKGVHYTISVQYTTQVLSQVAVTLQWAR